MPAVVETMFYVDETPWHGLGTKLDNPPTIHEAIRVAGLDWQVGTKKLCTVDGEPVSHKATYRETDGSILGVVGPRYVPLQNVDMLDWFDPFVSSKLVSLHTAGSLCDGQKVWVLAELNQAMYGQSNIVKGDDIAKFILLSNSHDGTTAIRLGFTPIRVVCANTLSMAHGAASSKLIRVRHSRHAKVNLDALRDVMNLANQEFETTADQYRYLATRQYCQKDLEKYVKIVLGIEKIAAADIKTRSRNMMIDILDRIESGRGQTLPGVKGTWYAAYNGVNEWLNYSRGRTENNRVNSLWFGVNGTANQSALDTAVVLAA